MSGSHPSGKGSGKDNVATEAEPPRRSSAYPPKPSRPRELVVAGVMSGTSADGIDVAICRIAPAKAASKTTSGVPRWELLGHRAFPFQKPVREAILHAMDAPTIAVADLARLSWRLGSLYADALEETAQALGQNIDLVGCHGQTLFHQTRPERFLGSPQRATWQAGEPAVIAERLRCPIVSDLRPADLAAGGEGAPLVPMFDWVVMRDSAEHRVLANLGGIANLTALPRGASLDQVIAFDTGPGNMVIDGCMRRLFHQPFDRDGQVAARGKVFAGEVMVAMRNAYFAAAPPKSCGREQFGDHFCDSFIARCRKLHAGEADIVATATALTSSSIVEAYEMFVASHFKRDEDAPAEVAFIAAGGGAANPSLMGMLEGAFQERQVTVRSVRELGVAPEAKEAAAFALLAWLSWWQLPGNVPSATGAARPVVLGKVSFG